MRRRFIVMICTFMLALISGAATALAGGWAVTSVDGIPAEFQAGESYTLTYTIRGHGQTPVDVNETFVSARSTTGETATFHAGPTGETGIYTVEVSFPSAGEWQWEVHQGWFGTQSLGTLQVVEPSLAASGSSSSIWTSSLVRFILPAAALVLAGLVALQGVLLVQMRRGPRPEEKVLPARQMSE